MNLLITGGAGFIGSHVVRYFVQNYPKYNIFNLDNLTYAGNLENISDIEYYDNYNFIKVDITNQSEINSLFKKIEFDGIIHLAAESHVDRSISNPLSFINTNVIGTVNLLNAFMTFSKKKLSNKRFYHVSTDEVYGSLGNEGYFTETNPYDPRSPYSASKASSDHFVRAFGETYGIPFVISNCSNNYGEFQFPEKLIPLFINNIINKRKLPVYGDGSNVRDWLYVRDHAYAIDLIFHKGRNKETYNIGGNNEYRNIDLINLLCDLMDIKLNRLMGDSRKLIEFINDRPGHDKRYAIDSDKIQKELGWKPSVSLEKGLEITIDWYLSNSKWLNNIVSGEYKNYYKKQYNK